MPTGPWPADLTPEQAADAQAAIDAYVGYYKLVDLAYAAPGQDWSAEAAKWSADPVRTNFLRNLAGTAERGQYRDGNIVVYPTVTRVQAGLVDISACFDGTAVGFYDKDGVSIKAPDQAGSYFRHPSQVQVAKYASGAWLVTVIVDDYNTPC